MWLKKSTGSVSELPEWWHSEVGSLKRNNHQEANIFSLWIAGISQLRYIKKSFRPYGYEYANHLWSSKQGSS